MVIFKKEKSEKVEVYREGHTNSQRTRFQNFIFIFLCYKCNCRTYFDNRNSIKLLYLWSPRYMPGMILPLDLTLEMYHMIENTFI